MDKDTEKFIEKIEGEICSKGLEIFGQSLQLVQLNTFIYAKINEIVIFLKTNKKGK